MDALTRAAITGTSREAPPASGLPTDNLLRSAEGNSPERDLLLRAGMYAVYRAAGRRAETGVELPQPAPWETLPACSARAAELVGDLLRRPHDPQDDTNWSLLKETLERLRRAGLRLPASLLPVALDGKRPRKLLLPVLGERGRWISSLNPAWRWVHEMDASGDEGTIWEEGALPQRLAVLERVRRREPACGREWLAGVWRQEKAETRNEMIAKQASRGTTSRFWNGRSTTRAKEYGQQLHGSFPAYRRARTRRGPSPGPIPYWWPTRDHPGSACPDVLGLAG